MTNIQYEKDLINKNIQYIAGVDEVGRGCLAGPMVVAAVILKVEDLRYLINNDVLSIENKPFTQITDSKLISPKKREELNEFIQKVAISYSIYAIEASVIDEIGISKATQLGFYTTIKTLSKVPEHVLTDAFAIKQFPEQIQTNLNKGDRKSISIGAASIIAKVFRDKLMTKLNEEEKYKKYAFDKHKGYGTKLHMDLLTEHGPSNIHRKSFEPIKSMIYK